MLEQNSAGKNIESYCTKCKLNLDHTIMAMAGETIAKVRCKTCGGAHKFKSPADAPKPRKPRVKKGAGSEATAEIIWEAGLSEAKGTFIMFGGPSLCRSNCEMRFPSRALPRCRPGVLPKISGLHHKSDLHCQISGTC